MRLVTYKDLIDSFHRPLVKNPHSVEFQQLIFHLMAMTITFQVNELPLKTKSVRKNLITIDAVITFYT